MGHRSADDTFDQVSKLANFRKKFERGLDGLGVVATFSDEKIELVELFPDRATEHLATLSSVFARELQAREDRVWVGFVESQKTDHILLCHFGITRKETFLISCRVDESFPLMIDLITQTEGQVQGHIDKASDVFGSFGIPSHPKNGVRYA